MQVLGVLLEVRTDHIEVFLQVSRRLLGFGFLVLDAAQFLNEPGRLTLDIVLLVEIELRPKILDSVLVEGGVVPLAGHEERQGDVGQNLLDMWPQLVTSLLELETAVQEFQAQR